MSRCSECEPEFSCWNGRMTCCRAPHPRPNIPHPEPSEEARRLCHAASEEPRLGHFGSVPCPSCLAIDSALSSAREPLEQRVKELEQENERYKAAAELQTADVAFWAEGGKFCLLLSDTFGYACADAEDIPLEIVPELLALYRRGGWYALVAWVAQRRGADVIPELRERVAAARTFLDPSHQEEKP